LSVRRWRCSPKAARIRNPPTPALHCTRYGTTVRVWDVPSRKVVARWNVSKLTKGDQADYRHPQGLMSVRWTGATRARAG